jgi:hypothetical protein
MSARKFKMAVSMSAEQVVEQMFDESEGEENSEEVNVGERLKRGLNSALIDGEVDKELFLSSCAHILEPLYELCRVGVQEAFGQGARVLASHPIRASTILKDEVRLWLKAIHRPLARKAGYRNAYRGQISRDIPREIFAIFAKVVQNSDGFGVPFCCHSDNKSREVVRFTTIRLLKELFVLLSGLLAEEVIFYFKRILASGSRKGHKVWLMVSEENDFIFTYNKNQGKLLISFYFGEWNVNGFAQHS